MKNVNLAIYPPVGTVKVSIPLGMSDKVLQEILAERQEWIRLKQSKVVARSLEQQKISNSGRQEGWVYLFGRGFKLDVVEAGRSASIVMVDNTQLRVDIGNLPNNYDTVNGMVDEWLRMQLKEKIKRLIDPLQQRVGVQVDEWRVRKMRTRWGTCNINDKRIWINLHIARYPLECLEYVLIHELVHLIERYHNKRFWDLIEYHIPNYSLVQEILHNPESQYYCHHR